LELSRRTDQVGEAIRETVAEIVGHGLKDPRIGFVTITRVEVTPDLRQARVLFSVLGDKAQKDKTLAGLQQAAGYIRREIGQRIQIRYTPQLNFQYDVGIDATDRVARLLEETQAATEEHRNAIASETSDDKEEP
jgi:ribosome-binding factor A